MYFVLVITIMLIMSIDIVNKKEKELRIEKEIKERKAFDIMTWQNSKLIFIFLLFFFYLIIRHTE